MSSPREQDLYCDILRCYEPPVSLGSGLLCRHHYVRTILYPNWVSRRDKLTQSLPADVPPWPREASGLKGRT